MFIDTSSELFRNVLQADSVDDVEDFITNIIALKNYYNTSISPISKRYNCVVPSIEQDWSVHSTKY